MVVIAGILFLAVVAIVAVVLLMLPHLCEGIVHYYGAPHLGWLAWIGMGRRDLPAVVSNTRAVADGYRSVKEEAAPGFQLGTWELEGDDERLAVRIHVHDPHVAYLSIVARPYRSGPLAGVLRAYGTVRVRLVDVGEGRRFHARLAPANLSMPFAIPIYVAAWALFEHADALATFRTTIPVALVLLLLWQVLWWAAHHASLEAATKRGLDLLERRQVRAADAA